MFSIYITHLVRTNYNGDFTKGKAFTSHLGYDILNYKDIQKEIRYSSSKYPAIFKNNNGYCNRYKQKIFYMVIKVNQQMSLLVGCVMIRVQK